MALLNKIYFDDILELLETELDSGINPDGDKFKTFLMHIILFFDKDGENFCVGSLTDKPEKEQTRIKNARKNVRAAIKEMQNHKMKFNKYWICFMKGLFILLEKNTNSMTIQNKYLKYKRENEDLHKLVAGKNIRTCGACHGDINTAIKEGVEKRLEDRPMDVKEMEEANNKLRNHNRDLKDILSKRDEYIKDIQKNQHESTDKAWEVVQSQMDKLQSEKLKLKDKNDKLTEKHSSEKMKLTEKHSTEKMKFQSEIKELKKNQTDVHKLNEKIIKQDIQIKELKKNKPSSGNEEKLLKMNKFLQNKIKQLEKEMGELTELMTI